MYMYTHVSTHCCLPILSHHCYGIGLIFGLRFRVCQLVGKMMNYAADARTKIGTNRLDLVQEVMMQRLYDKVSPLVTRFLHSCYSTKLIQLYLVLYMYKILSDGTVNHVAMYRIT